MSRKWLEREGLRWVDENIVTRDQYDRILSLYQDKKHAIGVLPILGSILLGLGVLSFVAANWQEIPQLVRLLLIMALMIASYAGGELFRRKGHEKLGLALTALGYVTFGAGIVLTGQMFHLVAYDIRAFVVWGTAGILLTYLYHSRFIYLLSLAVFTAAQLYSSMEYYQFNYIGFAIMAAGLGYYAWGRRNTLLTWCFSLSYVLHALIFVLNKDWKFLWFFIPVMALYTLGDWYKDRVTGYALQSVPLTAAYLFGAVTVLGWDNHPSDLDAIRANPYFYLAFLAVLFALSLAGKWRNKQITSAMEWVLLAPFLYLPSGISVLYLLALFFFSMYVLWRGYTEEWRFKINFGTVLFLCTTMIAYGKLTWDFMDKSLFFIIGGVLLLVLSWFLNRRNKRFLDEVKGGKPL